MSDLSWLLGAVTTENEAVYPMFPTVPNAQNPVWVHNPDAQTLAVTGFEECVPSVPNVPNEKQAPRTNHSVISVFSVSPGWLIHFTDRDPMHVTFSPDVNHADALACYPDAVAAEPVPGVMPCAAPVADPEDDLDDRITCKQCLNLHSSICSAAHPGGPVSANRGYRPAPDLLQRCNAFAQRQQLQQNPLQGSTT